MSKKLFVLIYIFGILTFQIYSFNSFDQFKRALFKKKVFQDLIGIDQYDVTRLKRFPGMFINKENKVQKPDPALNEAGHTVGSHEFRETVQIAIAILESQHQSREWLTGHIFDLEDVYFLDIEKRKPSHDKRLSKIIEIATIFPQDHILQIVGDQHASGHDTALFLDWAFDSNKSIFKRNSWEIKNAYKHIHWVFAGDLVDSGAYGVESLYVILKAFNANPDNIHIIRGNHESYFMNLDYGFYMELKEKFTELKKDERMEIYNLIYKIYSYLPAAFWVSFEANQGMYDWSLVCHGGIHEDDIEINDLFLATEQSQYKDKGMRQASKFVHQAVNAGYDYITGYMWTDFLPVKDRREQSSRGTPFDSLGEKQTKYFLQQHSSDKHIWKRIIRAHQHSMGGFKNLMPDIFLNKGMSLLWNENDPMVTTLSVMPCTGFGIPKDGGIVYSDFFPGIIHLAAVTLSHTMLEFYNLSNEHIPEWTKNMHQEVMEQITFRYNLEHNKPLVDLDNYQISYVTRAQKIKSISLQKEPQEEQLSVFEEQRKKINILIDTIQEQMRGRILSIEEIDDLSKNINEKGDEIVALKKEGILSKKEAKDLLKTLLELEDILKSKKIIQKKRSEKSSARKTRREKPSIEQEPIQPVQLKPSMNLQLPKPFSSFNSLSAYLYDLSSYFEYISKNNGLNINHNEVAVSNPVDYFMYLHQAALGLERTVRNTQKARDLHYVAGFFSEIANYLKNQRAYGQNLMNTELRHQAYYFSNSLQYFNFLSRYLQDRAYAMQQQRR